MTCDGKNHENIKERITKGTGKISTMINILKELCLGNLYFHAAKLFRDAFLLSSVLLNAECWVNLTQGDVEELESLDRLYLRRVFEASSSTPIPALYLELGVIPVRFKIQAKRIMYLHYILNRDEKELIFQVFKAQMDDPVKGDWILTVKDDLKLFNLNHMSMGSI